ncbi:hypothetical protein GS531_00700 [Rhodococcus hoagii]|nr:hypothetical protein [Prescottella equi]
MVKPDPPPVDVLLDTSGSMSDLIADALAEVEGVIANRGRTRIVACDTRAATPQIVRRAEDLKLTGGGGTDLRVGLDLLDTLKPRARIRVVITDTYTAWPESAPRGTRTIVAAVGGGRNVPDWAKLVEIPAH